MLRDPRGHTLGTSSRAAAERVDMALWRMLSYNDTPLADLAQARREDPGWLLPLVMQAGYLLSLTEPSMVAQATTWCSAAAGASGTGSAPAKGRPRAG